MKLLASILLLVGVCAAFALPSCSKADEPGYFQAAVKSSSNDATKCIELIEDGRVTLQGTKEDREQVMNRLYAIVKR